MRAPTICAFGGGAFDAAVQPGGYVIRPYRPAPGCDALSLNHPFFVV